MTAFSLPRRFESWGRVIRSEHAIAVPQFRDELRPLIQMHDGRPLLAVGLGRSYGDSCLNSGGRLIDMTHLNRIIAFDAEKGVIRAEAGLSIGDLLRVVVPKGWFLPTVPGTRFVTLGGAVANDVHGKNHHVAGSFGCAVSRLGLIRSDRGPVEIDIADGSPLSQATIAGLGLTGIIAWVELSLSPIRSAFLDVEQRAFHGVGEFFRLSGETQDFEHTVAWIDSASGQHFGRGIFQHARWRSDGNLEPHTDSATFGMPVDAPAFALNGFTVRMFNAVYYRLQRVGAPRQRMHYAPFFFPLDSVRRWNRLYGSRGFYQYQCVVPPETAEAAVAELLSQTARAGAGSFLAVLKLLGPKSSPGLLSFPREGATLALDFPNRGEQTLRLLARLDDVVREAGGRLYPAKDGRMPQTMFRAGYPQWTAFAREVDPAISSDFWRRVSQG